MRPPPWQGPPTPRPAGRLQLDQVLVLGSRDRQPLLKGVSADLEPGEVLCVFGPNRSGKTTLAKVLAGAVRPQSGTARIDGMDTASWQPEDPRHAMGYVPQTPIWLPGTVGEALSRFTPGAGVDEILTVAGRVGLAETIAALPMGLDTDIDMEGELTTGVT